MHPKMTLMKKRYLRMERTSLIAPSRGDVRATRIRLTEVATAHTVEAVEGDKLLAATFLK